jgi:hypothetical protein
MGYDPDSPVEKILTCRGVPEQGGGAPELDGVFRILVGDLSPK